MTEKLAEFELVMFAAVLALLPPITALPVALAFGEPAGWTAYKIMLAPFIVYAGYLFGRAWAL
jgi:hypothetical protein